jgi:hypothetical protein
MTDSAMPKPDNLNPLYRKPQHLPAYVQVCHALAVEAHRYAGQKRNKADGVVLEYHTHLNATLNILLMAGVDDEAILGAALLHDVLEDCEGYLESKIESLKLPEGASKAKILDALLWEKLEAQANATVEDITKVSRSIALVQSLTSPAGLGKAKRIARMIGASQLQDAAAVIKVAELAASLADDIITPSTRDVEEQREYSNYVWAAAKSASHVAYARSPQQRNPLLGRLFDLVRFLHDEHNAMIDYPEATLSDEEKQARCDGFSLNNAWSASSAMPALPKAIIAETYIEHPEKEALQAGISQVGITADKRVSRLRFIFDPESANAEQQNKLLHAFIMRLEHEDAGNMVTIGNLQSATPDGVKELKLKLLKPMALEQFLQVAQQSGAMESDGLFAYSTELAHARHGDKQAPGRWADKVRSSLSAETIRGA